MRTIKSWDEMKRMNVGEAVRLHSSLKNPFVRVEDYRCPSCSAFFMAPEEPNFCPKCGAALTFGAPRRLPAGTRRRWNGKAAAVVEEG